MYISGLKDRNRALNNDIVAIKLKEKYCWKILEPFKKQVEDRVKAYMVSSNVLDNAMTSAQSNMMDNPNKNKTSEFNQDLIDLAPMCFSKPDLLESLDNTWFQRTAIVKLTSISSFFQTIIFNEPFLNRLSELSKRKTAVSQLDTCDYSEMAITTATMETAIATVTRIVKNGLCFHPKTHVCHESR